MINALARAPKFKKTKKDTLIPHTRFLRFGRRVVRAFFCHRLFQIRCDGRFAHMWPLVTSLRLRARAGDAKRSPTLFVWCLRRGHKMTHM